MGNLTRALGLTTRINVIRFTASGTYTPSPGFVYAIAEGIGGGGGGGGANINSNALAGLFCAGGGGGGAYAKSLIRASDVTGTFAVQIGAGGSGGVNASGGIGGVTTIIRSDGSNNYMFLGANGGSGGDRISQESSANGGLGGTLGTGSIVNSLGPSGGTGVLPSGSTYIYPGNGADTRFGQGGKMIYNQWGATGLGYGSGGAGQCVYLASTGQSASGNGGAGAPGLVIITEYLSV